MKKANFIREHPAGMGGIQKIFHYPNGYGASVVQFPGSYGYEDGLWELAVLTMSNDNTDWEICYTTDITNDVLGYLSESEVDEILERIEALPDRR